MLNMKDETCKIEMLYETIDFKNIVIKPFFRNNESENVTDMKNKKVSENEKNGNTEEISQSQNDEISRPQNEEEAASQNSPEIPIKRDRDRLRKLSLRYRDTEADIFIFFQNDSQNDLLMQNMQAPTSIPISAPAPIPTPFMKSRKKEINGLFEKGCFEIVSIFDVFHGIRIFNSRFVDEIKNIDTINAYEKSRLVMQTYNDDDKAKMLIQTSTIQRMNQRLILTLTANMSHLNLFLRNISQTYVQSIISLAKKFFIRSPVELELENAIFKIIKLLYEISKAGAHWFNTYHKHHTEKLVMQQSTYDPCLLYTSKKGFGVVGLQIDDTLILKNETFANAENFHFHETKLLAKEKEKLTSQHQIKFNGAYIKQENSQENSQLENSQSLYLNQKRLCKNLRLIESKPKDLTNAKNVIRKSVAFEDQYVAQKTRNAYITTLNQSETTFDFSFAVQVINPQKNDAKRLNKRIQ